MDAQFKMREYSWSLLLVGTVVAFFDGNLWFTFQLRSTKYPVYTEIR